MLVVKIGGSIAEAGDGLMDEVASRDDVVLVHGFGPQTDAVCAERGVEVRTLRSPGGVVSRFTDEAVLEAMEAAASSVRSALLDALAERGDDPAGLGAAPPLFEAQVKPALRHVRDDGRVVLVRGNRSGSVRAVGPKPVQAAIAADRTPVVTPLAEDAQGLVSVDADRAAAALAGALDADALILLTDVPGLLRHSEDPGSRVESLSVDRIGDLIGDAVQGGMVRKLVAAREALDAGVARVCIGDGRREGPVERALSGDATEVTR